jgi:quinol monooxygenase YgiN
VDNQLRADWVPCYPLEGGEFMSVLAMVKMTVFPNKRTELLQTLETLKNSTCKADLGCTEYRFYQEGENGNNIILVMEWQTQERLEAYQVSDQFGILKGAISLLCASSEIRIGAVPIEPHH